MILVTDKFVNSEIKQRSKPFKVLVAPMNFATEPAVECWT